MPRRALLLVMILAACGPVPHPRHPDPPTKLEALAGTWGIEDGSNTVMAITIEADLPNVQAWASDDKSTFEVSDVAFDGHRLHLRFTYPRTGFSSTSDLELLDTHTLEGEGSGPSYHAHEVWRRLPDAAPAVEDKP